MKSKGSKINFSLAHFWVSMRQREVPHRAKVPTCNLLIRRMVVAAHVFWAGDTSGLIILSQSYACWRWPIQFRPMQYNLTSDLRESSWGAQPWLENDSQLKIFDKHSLIIGCKVIRLRNGVLRRRLSIRRRFMLGDPGRRIRGRVMPLLLLVRLWGTKLRLRVWRRCMWISLRHWSFWEAKLVKSWVILSICGEFLLVYWRRTDWSASVIKLLGSRCCEDRIVEELLKWRIRWFVNVIYATDFWLRHWVI